jgi:hypothetical protein
MGPDVARKDARVRGDGQSSACVVILRSEPFGGPWGKSGAGGFHFFVERTDVADHRFTFGDYSAVQDSAAEPIGADATCSRV